MSIFILLTLWIFGQLYTPLGEKLEYLSTSFFSPKVFRQETSKKNGENLVPQKTGVLRRKSSYVGTIESAKNLISKGEYAKATVELMQAIKEKPEILTPYLQLGEIYVQTEQSEKLSNLILKLKKDFPKDTRVAILEGRALILQKKFQEALKLFESVGDSLPSELKFYHAVLLAFQNSHPKAKKILENLKNIPEETNTITMGTGGVMERIEDASRQKVIGKDFAQKVSDFLTAYQEFEKIPEGKISHQLVLFGKVLAQNGECSLAKEFAEKAKLEDPNYADAWTLKGYCQYLKKDFENAEKDFRRAYEIDPNRPENNYFLGMILSDAGKGGEAIPLFEKILLEKFKYSEEVKWELAKLYTGNGRKADAIMLYQSLVTNDTPPKKIASAMHHLINVLGVPEVAFSITEKLLETSPEDIFRLNMYGWAGIANKKFTEAETALKKAEALDPGNPQTYLNLGLLWEEKGDTERAKRMYYKSYELGIKTQTSEEITALSAQKYNDLNQRQKNGINGQMIHQNPPSSP